MSKDEGQRRVEKVLDEILSGQQELCSRLERLEQRVAGLGGAAADNKNGPAPRREVLRFLDQFRAGEALGEASLGAWIAVSRTECVRGGLRTVQMREGMHARLLEQRIKELGGECRYEVPEEVCARAMRDAGNPDKPDARKVLEFVKRFPDPAAAIQPILAMADRLDADPETQSLLRTIAQDERSTLEFLGEACALLNPDPA